jgi:hypothetical protein
MDGTGAGFGKTAGFLLRKTRWQENQDQSRVKPRAAAPQ